MKISFHFLAAMFGLAFNVFAIERFVNLNSANPTPPYTDWGSAATNIQDAIDVAVAGDVIWVTNGVYVTGGRVMSGDLSNRVALNKALTVQSVNGPLVTTIQGAWDPSRTNGPLAVRCAWLSEGSSLIGFTLKGGATRSTGDVFSVQCGGGIWANSVNATVANCVLATNASNYGGGGCYRATLNRCRLIGNASLYGGGTYQATLVNCLAQGNYARSQGGGVFGGSVINCTVTGNLAMSMAGGVYGGSPWPVLIQNSIVVNNSTTGGAWANWSSGGLGYSISYSSIWPAASGTGNSAADPELLDGLHLAVTSPCRGAGNAAYVSGTDLNGNPWANPPSMGCFEVYDWAAVGPLTVRVVPIYATAVAGRSYGMFGLMTGWATRVGWWFGDGSELTNTSPLAVSHTWTNTGDYTVTFTAFNADNPQGVSTNFLVHVLPLVPPSISVGGLSGTNFSLSFPGQAGVTYVIENTTALTPPVTWQAVATNYNQGGLAQFTDRSATNAMRFYRVRSQ